MGRPAPAAASQPALRLARTGSGSWDSRRASALPVELWQLPSLCLFFFFSHISSVAGAQQAPGALRWQTGVIATLCRPVPCRRPRAGAHGRSRVSSRSWWASEHAPAWQSCVLPIPLCLGAMAIPSDASSSVKHLWGLKERKGAHVSETRVVGLAASHAPAPRAGGVAPGNISAGWECSRAVRLGWQREPLT